MERYTLAVLVKNRAGVLARVAGLFSRRAFNIHSLAVGTTEDPTVSRMTIVVKGDRDIVEQVEKQLSKLVDVIRVCEVDPGDSVERELLLIKVRASADVRSEIMQIVDIFRGQIVDVSHDSLVIEMTGNRSKVEAIIGLMERFGIQEMCRTGEVALERGENVISTL